MKEQKMSNSSNQTLIPSYSAEIVENERPVKLSPLRWSNFEQCVKKGELWKQWEYWVLYLD